MHREKTANNSIESDGEISFRVERLLFYLRERFNDTYPIFREM